MEIPLLVLVLQIGFNAALNNRGYNSNPLISSPPFVNSGLTRRLPEADRYLQLSSRGLPESDEKSDSGYSSSFEDYSYRSVRKLQNHPNLRTNDYLRNHSPVGRINSNNRVKNRQQSSSLSLRTDPYLKRLYLRNGAKDQTPQNFRKANDDSSLEISSLENSNSEDASRLGEEATYLRSLMSLIEQQENRRGQSRKYYRQGNRLSIDGSPIDKLNADEDNLPNSLNKKRNKITDANVDSIILETDDDDKPDEITIEKPKIESPKPTGLHYNNLYNRRYDDGKRRFNRKSNNNADLALPLNDNTEKLTVLRLASLEDLNLESPLLRSSDNRENNHKNFLRLSLEPDNKLSLDEGVASELSEIVSETLYGLNLAPVNLRSTDLPNNKYSRRKNNRLDAEENNLRSGSLDIPIPASPLRRYRGLTYRSTQRNLRTHGNHTRHVLKKVSSLRRYRNSANHSSSTSLKTHGNHTRQVLKKLSGEDTVMTLVHSLRTHGNHTREVPKTELDEDTAKTLKPSLRTHGNHTRQELKKKFDEDTAKTLVRYHEGRSNKLLNNRKHENQNNNRKDDDWPDEFSLDTLLAFKKDGNLSDDVTINQDHLSPEPSLLRSSDEILPKDDDVLHLEYPWNYSLSPNADKNTSQQRSDHKKDTSKDTTYALHLEFPWNDALSPDGDKSKIQLRTDEEKEKPKNTTDTWQLEFPWNGALSPDDDKSMSKLRTDEKKHKAKDGTDTLQLEFPWNDALSPDGDNGRLKLRSDEKRTNTKNTTDTLHLEFPWNDQLNPDGKKDKSQLKSDDEKNNTNDSADTLNLEFSGNDVLSPTSDKSKTQIRRQDDTKDILHLEYPWNDKLSPDENKTEAHLRSESDRQDREPKDDLKLEFPWNGQTSPEKPSNQKTLRIPDPFYIHPYLRSRNVNKHPKYFRQSYDEYSESVRLENLKNRRSGSHSRQSKRRRYDDLEVIGLTGRSSEEHPADLITFPSDRQPHSLRSKGNTLLLLTTTTFKPKHSKSIVKNRNKSDKQTYNDTILFISKELM